MKCKNSWILLPWSDPPVFSSFFFGSLFLLRQRHDLLHDKFSHIFLLETQRYRFKKFRYNRVGRLTWPYKLDMRQEIRTWLRLSLFLVMWPCTFIQEHKPHSPYRPGNRDSINLAASINTFTASIGTPSCAKPCAYRRIGLWLINTSGIIIYTSCLTISVADDFFKTCSHLHHSHKHFVLLFIT
jgi:hypothetical protein